MKLHDLHVLMAVVQAGSMNKAAVLLRTTQPAISRSITELEHTIGVRLLDRHPRGVELTDCGRALLDGGTAMFDELRLAVKNIEYLTDPAAGEIRVASNPVLATSFLSAVIDRMSRRHPRIAFHVLVKQADALRSELSDRNVDLLVARRLGNLEDERLNFEPLFEEAYVIAAGAQNPLVRQRNIELAELVNECWVLPPEDHVLGLVATKIFRASGLRYPAATVISASPDMRISLLAKGRFLSIFNDAVVKFPTGRPEIKILPVKMPVPPVSIGIVTLKNRTLSPVARLFIQHAREVAKPLAKRKA
jgi:DNA-binding transcriptional LysR family regulator